MSATTRHRLCIVALSLVLALGGVVAPWTARPAVAADASIVFAAMEVLRDRHVTAPDPVKLLAAALDGLRQALSQAGATAPLPVPIATSEAAAREEFQQLFDRAAAAAQGRLTETQLQYAAARAMAASLDDSHTAFFPPDAWSEILRELQNQPSFSGIGIRLLIREGRFYILDVFPGTPAARAGLQPFDRIVAVDGASTQGMTGAEIANRIRGPQGTAVTVTVRRAGQSSPLTFTITRDAIAIQPVAVRVLEDGVGYIRLHHLLEGSAGQFRRALQDLQQQGIRALVVDLRGNGGGLVGETIAVASTLLPPNLPVMVRESRQSRVTDITRGGPLLSPTVPVVALVDEATGSGAEVVAAAIQEHQRGVLVGTRTAGALLASLHFPLPGGTGIEVAVSRVTTGKGTVIEKSGVRPDVEVDLQTADIDQGVDTQFQRALQTLLQRVLAPAVLAPAA